MDPGPKVGKLHTVGGRPQRAVGTLVLMLTILAAVLTAMSMTEGRAEHRLPAGAPRAITVVLDDNYPPFIFRDERGALIGQLKDTWDLWAAKTGIKVNLRAMDWGQAIKTMSEGGADVIDTMFRTSARERLFDFSAPYATIEVPLLFHRDLDGIADVKNLRGFAVGVKDGDACLEWLVEHEISSLIRYPSYLALVEAAARRDVLVLCIDAPPANYLLFQKGLLDQFHHSPPLYSGQFHWAVRKGDQATYDLVQWGFNQITKAETQTLIDRWHGFRFSGIEWPPAFSELLRVLLVTAAAGLALLFWNWLLHRQVAFKTRKLTSAMAALSASEQRFRTIFDNVNDAICIVTLPNGQCLFFNQRMREMFRLDDRAPPTLALADLDGAGPPQDRPRLETLVAEAAAGRPQVFEWQTRRLDDSLLWVEVGMRRAHLDGSDQQLLVVLRDISERKTVQARMEFLAYHDTLTQLPNRLLLADRVEQAIAIAERRGSKVALLFGDLDQFKTVNDSLGHQVGDRLLSVVASRLAACVRDSDTVSRQGGDEFIILLTHVTDLDGVIEVVGRIQDALAKPVDIEGHDLVITMSTGIALYPDDGAQFESLLKKADMAMYHAKASGRNTHRFFAEEINVDAAIHLTVRSGLRRALENGEFTLDFQPQMRIGDGSLVGAEALIRWQHPDRGLVMPGAFIPIAEDSGLIIPIGTWVLREACRHAAAWERGGCPLRVAVNVSALQFRDGGLAAEVDAALAESGLSEALLELELTETTLLHGTGAVLSTIRRLRDRGVHLSIDDFGTGYSSLSYIKRLAVSQLKIDRSFIHDLNHNPESAAIVSAVIQMAHSLGLTTLAEGVEDPWTLDYLARRDCDFAQGYLIGRPVPCDRFDPLANQELPAISALV